MKTLRYCIWLRYYQWIVCSVYYSARVLKFQLCKFCWRALKGNKLIHHDDGLRQHTGGQTLRHMYQTCHCCCVESWKTCTLLSTLSYYSILCLHIPIYSKGTTGYRLFLPARVEAKTTTMPGPEIGDLTRETVGVVCFTMKSRWIELCQTMNHWRFTP